MTHSNNPADHKEHDPSRCDFARIWLTQKWIENPNTSLFALLDNDQLTVIGFKSCVYSNLEDVQAKEVYAAYNITQEQLFEFSEVIRNFLLQDRGLGKQISMNNPPNPEKVYLN